MKAFPLADLGREMYCREGKRGRFFKRNCVQKMVLAVFKLCFPEFPGVLAVLMQPNLQGVLVHLGASDACGLQLRPLGTFVFTSRTSGHEGSLLDSSGRNAWLF